MHPNEYRLVERTPTGITSTWAYTRLSLTAEQLGPAYVEVLEAQHQRQLEILAG
jgi:hypothetical protein